MEFVRIQTTHLGEKRPVFKQIRNERHLKALYRWIAHVQKIVSECADTASVHRPAEAYALNRIYALKMQRYLGKYTPEMRNALIEWSSHYLTDEELNT